MCVPTRPCSIALLAALAAGACGVEQGVASDPWGDARRRGVEFRAVGQEPGWYLEIDDGRSLRLVYDYMERQATTPAPTRKRSEGRIVYEASSQSDRVTVVSEDRPCNDIMSGDPHPRTVIVTVNGLDLHGCGRDLR